MGFFTDAYDLFVIGTVSAIVTTQWHLSTTEASWVTGVGPPRRFCRSVRVRQDRRRPRAQDRLCLVAAIMIVGPSRPRSRPDFLWLVVARFVLGLGIGGDYPVSAVLMSEYSNRPDRGRLVGMVFSMQALGLVVGPLVGLTLLSSGIATPSAGGCCSASARSRPPAVIYLRAKMPESPRFQERVQGEGRARRLVRQPRSPRESSTPLAVSVGARRHMGLESS